MLGKPIMLYPSISKYFSTKCFSTLFLSLLLAACGNEAPSAKTNEALTQPAEAQQAPQS